MRPGEILLARCKRDGCEASRLAMGILRCFNSAEFDARQPAGFGLPHTSPHEVLHREIQVRFRFFLKLAVQGFSPNRERKRAQSCFSPLILCRFRPSQPAPGPSPPLAFPSAICLPSSAACRLS
jgi:hypothetical protein